MNKKIFFFTIFSALNFNIHVLSAMDKAEEPSVPLVFIFGMSDQELDAMADAHNLAAFKKANPLPGPCTKYIPFMGNIYSVTITDPKTNKSYVARDAYDLYCARQHAANNPALQPAYYQTLKQRLNELRQ